MVSEAFFSFIRQRATATEALYILGDLFEAWWGDDNPDPLPRKVIAELKRLTLDGTPVFFIHGNRDFAIAHRFSRETGCTLLKDTHLLKIANKTILLMHGDTLCTDDVSYQRYRHLVRNPLVLGLLRSLPQTLRRSLAEKGRAKSQQSNRKKSEYIMDVNSTTVVENFIQYQADVIIHGHTHRPARHTYLIDGKPCERIVLGDWNEKSGWCAVMDSSGSISLEEFPCS